MHSSPLQTMVDRGQNQLRGFVIPTVVAFMVIVSLASTTLAGSPSRVTLATAPEPFSSPIPPATSEGNGKPGPEDLSARGQELDNTFYEIEATPPYGNLPPTKPGNNSAPVKGMEGLNEGKAGMSWSMWAAGAAGIVGLGALGYLVLSDDSNKSAEEHVRIISDK